MRTLEELRRGLESIEELGSIVRTMKALSAASIRQYEEAVRSLGHYYRTVELGLHVVLRHLPEEETHSPEPEGAIAVVFGSDRGLCGHFNRQIADFALEHLDALAPVPDRSLLVVGARAASRLEAAGQPVRETLAVPASAEGIADTAARVLVTLDRWMAGGAPRRVLLLFNRHRTGAEYRPTAFPLLPVRLAGFRRLEEEPWPTRQLPAFAGDPRRLFQALLREYFFVSVHRASAESLASEHAARLLAMQGAEQKIAEEHEETLRLLRQKRQDEITAELLDVVSGYEALTGEEW